MHNDPKNALSDSAQQLTPEEFEKLSKRISVVRDALNSRIKRTVGGDDDNASRIDDGLGPRRGRRTRDDDFDGTWKGD